MELFKAFGKTFVLYSPADGPPLGDPARKWKVLGRMRWFTTDAGQRVMWVEMGESGQTRTMLWRPETPDEIEAARRFYDGARGVGPDAPEQRRLKAGAPIRRTPEEQRLIAAILARPDADPPYHDYADWLEAAGDPYGPYIRARIGLERTSPNTSPTTWMKHHHIVEALKEEHAEEWIKPLTDLGLQPQIMDIRNVDLWLTNRGTIQELEIDRPGILPENAARFFGGAPLIRRLRLNDESCDVGKICRVPQMAQVEELDCGHAAPPHFLEMCRSPHLAKLRALKLYFDSDAPPLGEEGGRVLAGARWLAGLRKLDLTHAKLGGRGIHCFVSVPAVNRLEHLELRSDGDTGDGLTAVLSSMQLSGLQALIWSGNKCRPDSFALFPDARFGDKLRELGLSACVEEGDVGVAAGILAEASFARLERFDFSGNRLDTDAMAALLAAPWPTGLRTLNLSETRAGDAELKLLANTDFRRLEQLQLESNHFGDAGVIALCEGLSWSSLKTLNLMASDDQPPPGRDAARALASSRRFPNLVELDLRGFALGTAGAEALAGSTRLGSLKKLSVTARLAGPDGVSMLRKRFGDKAIKAF